MLLKRLSTRGGHRATVIEYTETNDSSGQQRLNALHEVILSGGPYGTPKLLQLSGIGPAEVYERAGVNIQVELPVGAKTQARPALAVTLTHNAPVDPAANTSILEDPTIRAAWEAGRGTVLGQSQAKIVGPVAFTPT